jgi:hypothetical protein
MVRSEALLDDALAVDAPPAHHAVSHPISHPIPVGFNELGEFRLLRSRNLPRTPVAVAVFQAGRTMCVEAMHPIL